MEPEFDNLEPQNNLDQYKEIEKDFINKVKKYLKYRNESNLSNVTDLVNSLDTQNFNQLMTYFERQKNITKNPLTKQDLGNLYSKVLSCRNDAVKASVEKAISINLDIESAGLRKEGKTIAFQGKNIERVGTGSKYLVNLDFGEGNINEFYVKTEGGSIQISDKNECLTKCQVEKIGGELKTNDTIIGTQVKYIEKKYRVTVGSLFFTLKFND